MTNRPYRAWAALAAVIALVYAPVLNAPVLYDDLSHVRDNPAFDLPFARFWLGLTSRDYFAFVQERTYQPLVTLFHYFTHASPLVYRSAGLALHALNAGLVFEVARRLTGRVRSAVLAAALFAFFPAHTEALNFSAFKGHLLAAFFVLAVVVGVMELCSRKDARDERLPAALGCLLAFALLSKESGLTAVALAAAYAAFFARDRAERLKPAALVFAALTGGYFAYRFVWLAPPPPFPAKFEYSTLDALAFYAQTLALPCSSCLEHSSWAGARSWWWLVVAAVLLWRSRKSREALFCWAWIVLSLLPVLHFVSFTNVSPVADRYLYLPAAGLCLLLATWARDRNREQLLGGLLIVWTGLTVLRNADYRSARSLFEQTARCAPDNARAHFLAGNARFADKDYAAARLSYQRVLILTPSEGARQALAEIDRLEKKP